MQRRDFMKLTALATGAININSLSFAGTMAAKPLQMKSLKFDMVKEDLSLVEKFKLLKEIGFDGVEMHSPNDLDNREIVKARQESGLEIPGVVNSVHWKSPLSDPDPAVRQECIDSMITAFNDCKEYGGTTALLVPAVVNDSISYADAWDRSTAAIKELLPEAEKTGIKIAIENVWNNFLLSPLEAARYIDQFNSNMIGWYFDVGNILRYGWPEQWIKILGDRIIKIDIKEYSREKQREEGIYKGFQVKLNEGDCNWPAVNKALTEVGYQGWGSAEVPGGDRKRLQEIYQRMEQLYSA